MSPITDTLGGPLTRAEQVSSVSGVTSEAFDELASGVKAYLCADDLTKVSSAAPGGGPR